MAANARGELVAALADYVRAARGESPFETAIAGVTIMRSERPKRPMPFIHRPALCIVAQGAKRGIFGETQLEYRAGQALVVGIDTPTIGRVSQASSEEPFLGMVVEFDFALMREVLGAIGTTARPVRGGVFVANLSNEIYDCATRLVRLMAKPAAVATIAPLIARELGYWLLTSPYGGQLAAMIVEGERDHGIVTAIHTLRTRFAETIHIDELAAAARMSPSTFHRQFKTVTAMTPLQYQKQMRLLEARHLMIAGDASAESTAFKVGYESQSQFSREYARMFGAPPRRDIRTLRARAGNVAG